MASRISYSDVRDEMTPDGSLRDVYLFNTSASVVRSYCEFVQSAEWPSTLQRGDKALGSISEAGDLWDPEQQRVLLTVDVAGARVNSHFFTPNEIELDFDPREVTESNWAAIQDFLEFSSQQTARNAFLTLENSPECGILYMTPGGDAVCLPRRPKIRTAFGDDVIRRMAPLLDQLSGERGVPPTNESLQREVAIWKEQRVFDPSDPRWHTEITAQEYRVIMSFDAWLDCCDGSTDIESMSLRSGIGKGMLQNQFWKAMGDALVIARPAG